MKILTLILFAVSGLAQTHSATITITDTLNPSGTVYNVYRASGTCPLPVSGAVTPLPGPPIAPNIATKTYTDNTVPVGVFCYAVTAVITPAGGAAIESVQTQAATVAQPFTVQFTVTVK